MMSVTSSFTPGDDVELVEGVVEADWVTAAPGIEDSRVRRRLLPSVWPKPGSSGEIGEALPVALGFAERLDGRALDHQHVRRLP